MMNPTKYEVWVGLRRCAHEVDRLGAGLQTPAGMLAESARLLSC
jgi:hypothetical protein